MISSMNALGGLSAADLTALFGTTSSSSAGTTATSGATSASSGTSVSAANNQAKAIQAILARAQVEKAQTATSASGTVVSTAVAAAYAAQTSGGSVAGAVVETAQAIQSSEASIAETTVQMAYTAQLDGSSSLPGANVTNSSVSAVQQMYDAAFKLGNVPIEDPNGAGTLVASSLVVGTSSGVVGVATGHSGPETPYAGSADQDMALAASDALEAYQFNVGIVRDQDASSQVPGGQASASSASTGDGTGASASSSTYLRLTITSDQPGVPSFDSVIEAQAQNLIASFESNTAASASSGSTGFTYSANNGRGWSYAITGVEVQSNSNAASWDIVPTSARANSTSPDLASLYNESVGSMDYSGGINFMIPLGTS